MSHPKSPPLTDDNVLVSLIAQGDQAAFSQFMTAHMRSITIFSVRFLSSREDGEDTAQAVFMDVWRKAAQFDSKKASAKTWLYRIARNRCIDVIRKRRLRYLIGLDTGEVEVPVDAPTSFQTVADRQDLRAVVHAIDLLPDRQRLALVLSVLSEFPTKDIAEVMGTSDGAVEQLISRARRTLRSKFRATSAEG